MANYYSRSPPPLQHPVPTHPAFIPEPPATPVSPQGYQRYTSSPPAAGSHSQANINHPSAVGMAAAAAASGYPQFQPQVQGTMHPGAQPAPGHGVPDFSSWGIDGATAQLGMQLGQNAVNVGQQYMQKNVRFGFLFFVLSRVMSAAGVLNRTLGTARRDIAHNTTEISIQRLQLVCHP